MNEPALRLRLHPCARLEEHPDGVAVHLEDKTWVMPSEQYEAVVRRVRQNRGADDDAQSLRIEELVAGGVLTHGDVIGGTVSGGGVPCVLGDYALVGKIGEGRYGTVWRATGPEGRSTVAVKVLKENNPEYLQDLKREARVVWSLDHPSLVVPTGLHCDANRWYVVLEWVDGPTLSEAVAELTDGVTPTLLTYYRSLASALEYLHSNGVVHGDLKPPNILVRPSGKLALLDFGLASRTGALPSLQTEPGIRGTAMYLAPEILQGAVLSEASDWYALGALLYELVTGFVPHEDMGEQGLLNRALGHPPTPLPADTVSAELANHIMALLDTVPAQRHPAYWGSPDAHTDSGASLECVGRDDLRQQIGQLLQANRGVSPTLVVIHGESGMGKSTIARAIASDLAATGRQVYIGAAHENETVPFGCLDGIVDAVVGHETRSLNAASPLHRAFPHLFDPATPDEPPRVEQATLEPAFADLFRSRTSGDAVVIIDDAQWADVDSARLIRALLSGQMTTAVVLLSRVASSFPFLDAMVGQAGTDCPAVTIPVEPLGEQYLSVVLDRAGGAALSDADQAVIVEQSHGNPYLVVQSVVELLNPEPIDDDEQRLFDHMVHGPDVMSRSMLLKLQAHIGILGDHALVRLGLRGRIARRGGRSDNPFVVSHARLRELRASQMSPDEHRSVHRTWDSCLDELNAAAAIRYRPVAALGLSERASAYAETAGHEARAIAAPASAATWFKRAAEHAVNPDDVVRNLTHQAESEGAAGRPIEAGRVWEALTQRDASRADEHRLRASEAYLLGGAYAEGVAQLESRLVSWGLASSRSRWKLVASLAVRLATLWWRGPAWKPKKTSSDPAKGQALDILARGLCFVDPVRGSEFSLLAHSQAQQAGDVHRASNMGAFIAANMLFHVRPLRRLARACLSHARESTRESEHATSVALWEGMAAWAPGDWERAEALVGQNLASPPPTNARGHWERNVATGLRLLILQLRGDMVSLAVQAEDSLRDAQLRGDLYGQLLFSQFAAFSAIAKGNTARSHRLARWVRSEWLEYGYTVIAFYGMLLSVYSHLYDGQVDQAWALWEADQQPLRKAGFLMVPQGRIDNNLIHARLLLLTPDAPKRTKELRRLAKAMRKEQRTDANGYAAWLEAATSTTTEGADHSSVCAEFMAGGQEHFARWLDGQTDWEGFSEPERWFGVFLPGLDRPDRQSRSSS